MAERFPPHVHRLLRRAGWFPGRRDEAIVGILGKRTEQRRIFQAAREVLLEFGGLRVDLTVPASGFVCESMTFDPTPLLSAVELFDQASQAVGVELYPVANLGEENAAVAVGEDGQVFEVSFILAPQVRHAGRNFDEAISRLLQCEPLELVTKAPPRQSSP